MFQVRPEFLKNGRAAQYPGVGGGPGLSLAYVSWASVSGGGGRGWEGLHRASTGPPLPATVLCPWCQQPPGGPQSWETQSALSSHKSSLAQGRPEGFSAVTEVLCVRAVR